jgi:tetratricopeptide (TPR) repeat protein
MHAGDDAGTLGRMHDDLALPQSAGAAHPASNHDSPEHRSLDEALARLHAHRGDIDSALDEALRHDPRCVMAHVVRASVRLLGADRPRDRAALRALAAAGRLHANARERAHIEALRAWHEGDTRGALERYDALLAGDPHDSLALHVAHALDFRLGDRERLRDRVAAVLPHWRDGMPHFGAVLGMYAFGLEETGDYANAEKIARRSLALVPDNAAAVHVIAHVLEMKGHAREGIAWLEAMRPIWSRSAGFAVHLAWHLALFHLDRDDAARALAIYDDTLRPGQRVSTAALVDASALLWRLALRGIDVRARWRAVARRWQRKRLREMRAFNLVHAVLAFAAAHRGHRARAVVELMRSDVATRRANTAHDLELSVPVGEALVAFARDDYPRAIERLARVREIAEHCGGSVAQCDLILLTYVEAALRGRRARLAQTLAAERTARKPRSRLNRWLFARAGAAASTA